MAQVTFNVKDALLPEAENAIAALNGYTGFLEDKVTPETKTQFMRRWLKRQVRDQIVENRNRQAVTQALATAAAQDSEV